MKRRIILIIALIVAILLFIFSMIIHTLKIDIHDKSNFLSGDNSVDLDYDNNILSNFAFSSLEEAIPIVTKRDSNYKDGEVIYQTTVENYAAVFFRQENSFSGQKYVSIIGYEFVANEKGTFHYVGKRMITNAKGLTAQYHGWKRTVLSDLGYSTNKFYKENLNVREKYGILPAWGLSDNELVKTMTVDGQKIDKVIEFSVGENVYYFWFISDLQSDQDAMNIEIKEE